MHESYYLLCVELTGKVLWIYVCHPISPLENIYVNDDDNNDEE